ncbi:MAG: lipase family protein [Gordonia sp. (in: high G+C Gram-positive bacteria)]
MSIVRTRRRRRHRLPAAVLAVAAIGGVAATAPNDADAAPAGAPGAISANRQVPRSALIPGAARANVFTYWTRGLDDTAQLSTATLLLPFTPKPRGGYRVVVWAYGSRGLADNCAPSVHPSAEDLDEAKRWLAAGYAVVSSDYAGLGTTGTPLYFDSDAAARNIVDAVSASHHISDSLARSWVVVGRGRGAAVAVTLARTATSLQGPALDFRGAAASSIPAQFPNLLTALGPDTPVLPVGLTADALYTLSAINLAKPEVDLVDYLTEAGRHWINRAAELCAADLTRQVSGLRLGSLFTKSLSSNRELSGALSAASQLPIRGFTRPVLMGQGLVDPTVVVPLTLKYINDARLADSHVVARPYPVFRFSQATALSDKDFRWFVARQLR